MTELFGIDIAQTIADAFSGQLVEGALEKKTPGTRTSGSLTGGTNPATTAHTFDGFVEAKEVRRQGEVGTESMVVVTIIGNSVNPLVIPEVNDEVTIEGLTYTLVELLSRDPASAVYEFSAS